MWELDYKESWAPKNWCFESPLDCKEINQPILKEIRADYALEGLMLKLNSNTLATWCKELTHWKTPWCWERLKAGGDRGWDGWMASPTRWIWVWANSGSWWWTGKPGLLQSMGSLSWTGLNWPNFHLGLFPLRSYHKFVSLFSKNYNVFPKLSQSCSSFFCKH